MSCVKENSNFNSSFFCPTCYSTAIDREPFQFIGDAHIVVFGIQCPRCKAWVRSTPKSRSEFSLDGSHQREIMDQLGRCKVNDRSKEQPIEIKNQDNNSLSGVIGKMKSDSKWGSDAEYIAKKLRSIPYLVAIALFVFCSVCFRLITWAKSD